MAKLTESTLAYRIGMVMCLFVLQLCTVAAVGAVDQGSLSSRTGESESLDVSEISIVSLESKQGDLGPEKVFELRNGSKHAVTYGGYGAEAPAWRRQCFTDGAWIEDEQGWCGVGLESQTLLPGGRVKFSAQLCRTGESSRIGVVIGTPAQRSGEMVWSNSAGLPEP